MGAPAGGNVYTQASQGLTGAMGATAQQAFQPMQTGPMTVAGSNMGQYMNPYTNQVIGNLARDTGRAMEMGSNQLGAQASSAGAFGGSRHGIAQGQMMGDTLRGFQTQAGQLRQSGYQNAQQMAQQDVQNRMAANQQRLGAANQLAGLGMQGFNMGQQMSNQSFQQGLAQQAVNQALIDAAKQQYAGFTGAPAQSLQYTTTALGATPTPQSQTQAVSKSPGVFDYLTLGATAFGGFGN